MPSHSKADEKPIGSYFVSNYPPFSQWENDQVPRALAALRTPSPSSTPLGLYIHIPFCRKRCKFCYFKVYTDKNASQIETYLKGLVQEWKLLHRMPALAGRTMRYVYFGGGTPSYLSERQLLRLVEDLQADLDWTQAEEVTFECEPGTLSRGKLETLKRIGVTRLSLGIENFNDSILQTNGRAHLSAEIYQAYHWAREIGFAQINIDLIAGMMGETEENWRDCVERAIELQPDSVTLYQMELPYNTVFSQEITAGEEIPFSDWETKRRWVAHAFEQLEARGFRVTSATTASHVESGAPFCYTDSLWHGADMICLGVSAFGHIQGVHYQNYHGFDQYLAPLDEGALPIYRAFELTPHQRFLRELILQLKTGRLELPYFQSKFGIEVRAVFAPLWRELEQAGMLHDDPGSVSLTRQGLLRVDSFLWDFFEDEYRDVRYT